MLMYRLYLLVLLVLEKLFIKKGFTRYLINTILFSDFIEPCLSLALLLSMLSQFYLHRHPNTLCRVGDAAIHHTPQDFHLGMQTKVFILKYYKNSDFRAN